jgi:glycosyltransferase involved in cell wall biosynthesis
VIAGLRLVAFCDSRERGGAEISLATLLRALDSSIEVVVMGPDAETVEWVASHRPGASVELVRRSRGYRDAHGFRSRLSAIRRVRPDVFQANLTNPWFTQDALAAAALVRGVRSIAVVHLPTAPPSPRVRRLTRLVSRTLAAHIAVGKASARELEALIGLPAGAVRTIYNGVEDTASSAQAGSHRDRTVLAVGRLHRQKGFDVLLRAVAAVDDVRAILVGDGEERRALEALAGKLGIGGRVEFTGWVERVHERFATADVLALPSRFEAFPMTILEAMSAGLAVVATDVGSVGEAVVEGETGLLVPPENVEALAAAIAELLDDDVRRIELGRRGRDRVRQLFTAETMARAYEQLYANVIR